MKQVILEDLSVEDRIKYIESRKVKVDNNTLTGESAKYRCEQMNITRVDDNFVSSTLQKVQYDIMLNLDKRMAKVILVDFFSQNTPDVLNKIFDFISETEKIRNNVLFVIGDDGKVKKVINKNEQRKMWIEFINSEKFNSEFIKSLREKNKEALENIYKEGDRQFSEEHPSEFEYQSSLFYNIIFGNHLTANNILDVQYGNLKFASSLFTQFSIPLNVKTKVKEDNDYVNILIKGLPDISDTIQKEIEALYTKYYKPTIHYAFSEYILDYEINMRVHKKTRLVEESKVKIIESVKNNIENSCEFSLRKLS